MIYAIINSASDFYYKIYRQLNLIESYSEIKNIDKIIRMCRLKPLDYQKAVKIDNLFFYRTWFDELGSSVCFNETKGFLIKLNDLNINHNKMTCTDLYYGLDLYQIKKISKLALFTIGKDEDLNQDFCIISYLGIDNFLRTYLYMYHEWNPISSLILGLDNLQEIADFNLKEYEIRELNNKISCPCINQKTWLTCLPMRDNVITSEYQYLKPVIGDY